MPRIHAPRVRIVRYALVAALAFTLGSATVVAAGPVVSGFVGLIDGTNTAAINANRELAVTDAAAEAGLAAAAGHLANIATDTSQLSFDASGNLMTAPQGSQSVSGTVNVGNFPTTQQVAGTVNVGNLPRTSVVLTMADLGGTIVPASGLVRFFDASPYERIRVTAGNICTSTATVMVEVRNNDGFGTLVDIYALAPCTTQDKVYDLPGVNLNTAVYYSGGATSGAKIFLRVLGR